MKTDLIGWLCWHGWLGWLGWLLRLGWLVKLVLPERVVLTDWIVVFLMGWWRRLTVIGLIDWLHWLIGWRDCLRWKWLAQLVGRRCYHCWKWLAWLTDLIDWLIGWKGCFCWYWLIWLTYCWYDCFPGKLTGWFVFLSSVLIDLIVYLGSILVFDSGENEEGQSPLCGAIDCKTIEGNHFNFFAAEIWRQTLKR